MQKTLEKIYAPSQDQIIDGLSHFNEEQTNLLHGHEQNIEMTNLLQKNHSESAGSVAAMDGLHIQEKYLADQGQWA